MTRKVLLALMLAFLGYVFTFVVLVILNGVLASGLSDQEYGQSASLAWFTLLSKAGMSFVIGVIMGFRLARRYAVTLSVMMMAAIVALGHLLPGGGLIFSMYGDGLLWQQMAAVIVAGIAAWIFGRRETQTSSAPAIPLSS